MPPDYGQAVFVYGSLKQRMAHHHRLAGCPYLGAALLRGAWLHDLGPFPMAVLAAAAGPRAVVLGEIYRVTPAVLGQLDRFEGAPRLYERHWLELVNHSYAWVYLGRAQQVRFSPRLVDGCWRGPAGRR